MQVQEILGEIIKICRRNKVKELFLFGSYADGTETPTSDIDIIVKGADDIGALQEELDGIRTLKRIDIFDYDACENENLLEAMDHYGKRLY